jgi:polysaccharide export outer membrane protein
MNKFDMKKYCLLYFVLLLLASCATKKDVLLFQEKSKLNAAIVYKAPKIQVNDILSVQVSTLQTELAAPYNVNSQSATSVNVESLKLQGYLVNADGQITFPILGTIKVNDKTPQELELFLKAKLQDENHLLAPTVSVRIINSKVTILGEVGNPGTFPYTEQNISVLQAIGMAGDLTIKGKRKEVLLIREVDGQRSYTTLDLTQTDWFTSEYYYIKQNDVLVVNPNSSKVKNYGFIGDPATLLGVSSVILSMIILLTR